MVVGTENYCRIRSQRKMYKKQMKLLLLYGLEDKNLSKDVSVQTLSFHVCDHTSDLPPGARSALILILIMLIMLMMLILMVLK